MATVKKDDFKKSLDRLQDMAKGSQLHHTGADSSQSEWSGGKTEEQDDTGSSISANGTDYEGVRKSLASKIRKSLALTPAEVAIADGRNPMPAIQAKMAKGQALTPAETWAIKGGFDLSTNTFAKGSTKPAPAGKSGEADDADSVPESNAGGKEGEIEGDAKKSFSGAIANSPELQKGLELSPFLYEMTQAIGAALAGSESRVVKSLAATLGGLVERVATLEKSQSAANGAQEDFNKSLAEAVVGIGEAIGATVDATAAQAHYPVGAPKSQMREAQGGQGVSVVNKSYSGPGGLEMNINKSQISDALVELVKSNKVQPLEAIRFESDGKLLPATRVKIEEYYRSGN